MKYCWRKLAEETELERAEILPWPKPPARDAFWEVTPVSTFPWTDWPPKPPLALPPPPPPRELPPPPPPLPPPPPPWAHAGDAEAIRAAVTSPTPSFVQSAGRMFAPRGGNVRATRYYAAPA